MRKLTKVLVLAAAFTALFALTALAKTGWASDENGWYYVGTDGEKVTEETRNSNGKIYYLGEDGYMVKNFAVKLGEAENLYYFGEDGARVANQWQLLPEDEDAESGETERWYRFGSNGAALRATGDAAVLVKKIEDKYYGFDANGKMLFGFVDEEGNMINGEEDPILKCEWYFGDNTDGAMKTGWVEYLDGFTTIDAESAWFYFHTSKGKKYKDQTTLIGQKYYTFKADGRMSSGWAIASPDTATKSYWESNGVMKKNSWVYAARLDGTEDAKAWYYLDGKGHANADYAGQVKYIKKKYYVFNDDATDPYMLSGLRYLAVDDIKSEAASVVLDPTEVPSKWSELKTLGKKNLFFFSKNENAGGGVDGWAMSGAVTVDFDDETVTLNFDKYTYVALDGVKSGVLYNFGQLQKASDKYNEKTVNGHKYFVDENGKVVYKAGKYTDAAATIFVYKSTKTVSNDADCVPDYKVADDEYAYKDSKGNTKYAKATTVASDIVKLGEAAFNAKYVKNLSDFAY
ncbi:MAG: hypothetical protein Q4A04_07240 [Eubacteriales bacterium]|nr:hypothetical protein [Eubacteriales bacterium]